MKEIALTRGRISQLRSLIGHIQQSLSLELGHPQSLDARQREESVEKLAADLAKHESRFYHRITEAPDEATAHDPRFDPSDRAQLHAAEERDQLDHILGTATHLKEIGYEINEEIGVHIGLLEEIEDRENHLLSKQRSNEKLLREWMNSKASSMTCLWSLVLLLFLFLFYVLML